MAMTYRDEKGSPLSADEVDENFRTLEALINDSTGETGVGVASISAAAGALTFHMTDGSTQGPFTMPTAAFNDTGTWQAETAYAMLDLFTVANTGLYLVLIPHESGTEFDPTLIDTEGNPMLQLVLSMANGPQVVIEAGDIGGDTIVTTWRNAYVRADLPSSDSIFVDADNEFAVGDTITFRQVGVGQITFTSADTGVVINSPESLTTRKQGATVTLIKVGTNEYDLAGDLELLPVEPATTTDMFLTTTEPPLTTGA